MLFEYHKQPIKFIFKYLKVCILIKMFNSVFIGLKGMDCTKGNSMGSSLKLSFETTVYLLQVSINSIKTYVLNNIINKKQSINGTWTTYNHPSNTQCHISSCLVLQQHGNLCIPKEGWVWGNSAKDYIIICIKCQWFIRIKAYLHLFEESIQKLLTQLISIVGLFSNNLNFWDKWQ